MNNYDLALTILASAVMITTLVTGFFLHKEMKDLP